MPKSGSALPKPIKLHLGENGTFKIGDSPALFVGKDDAGRRVFAISTGSKNNPTMFFNEGQDSDVFPFYGDFRGGIY
jgi:hypothetical protein